MNGSTDALARVLLQDSIYRVDYLRKALSQVSNLLISVRKSFHDSTAEDGCEDKPGETPNIEYTEAAESIAE